MKIYLLIIFTLLILSQNVFAQIRQQQKIGLTTLTDEGAEFTIDRSTRFIAGGVFDGGAIFNSGLTVQGSPILLFGTGITGGGFITLASGDIDLLSGSYKLNGTSISSIFSSLGAPNIYDRVQTFDTLKSTSDFNLRVGNDSYFQMTSDGSWLADHYDLYTKGVKRFSVDGDSNKIKIFSGDNEISLWNNNGVLDINAPVNIQGVIEAENLTISGSLDLSSATVEGLPTDTNTYIKKYGDFTKEDNLYIGGVLHVDTINTMDDNSYTLGNIINLKAADAINFEVAGTYVLLGDDGLEVNSFGGNSRITSSWNIYLTASHNVFLNGGTIVEGILTLDTIVGNIYNEGNNTWKGSNTFSKIEAGTFSSAPLSVSNDTVFASSGTNFTKTLSANTTFKLKEISDGQTITFAVTNTTGNYTTDWASLDGLTIYWPGNTTPTQTTGDHVDVYTFKRIGSDIYGSVVQNYK